MNLIELEKQIDAETDPKRKQALQERLKAYQDLLSAAGKLESLQTAKPKTGKNGGSSKSSSDADASVSYRKFGESLATFDPTSGERRKMGESFKHLDVQKKLSDAQGGDTSEKPAAATEQYAKESAESLEAIKEELTRSSR